VIAFAVNLVRIVVVLMILRFVLRFLAAVVQGYQDAPRREPATDMVRDRVCDTFLPRSRALVAIVDGREQHFCSPECRERARRLIAT
jgi:Na+-transporting methylmalonyl-CoA/oxaloacetate decarboxylase gamma subunit